MSGLAGVFRLDGRPADRALLERMTAAISHRGPDGIRHVVDGSAALGHCMLCTTPESVQETQPLWDESGRCCLAMDGRVDNRGDLAAALRAAECRPRDDTDAEMVLQAYMTWGEECPRRIIGDFAFAIYDKPNRQLFCARDPLGVKPFYYWTDKRVFLWASELQQLFQDPAVRKEPNEGMVAEYLSADITSLDETLYAGILRLPPAHALTVGHGRSVLRRYWDADPARTVHCGSTSEYADRFRGVFKEAVRCRLRSQRPVGAELSGGLDSSSVVAACQLLFREGAAQDQGFETFSLVFPGLPCDESEFIDAMADRWRLKSNRFEPDNGQWYHDSVRRHQDFPDHPNGYMGVPIYAELGRRGFRAYLSGVGGDQWLDRWCEVTWRDRVRSVVERWPGLLMPARRALGRRTHPAWIPDEFARRVRLAERLVPRRASWRFRSLPQRRQHAMLTDGHSVHALEMLDRITARFGIEPRHPFFDRRVVEFTLPLPDALHRDGAVGKVLLRAAMWDLLPPLVRERRSKAEFSHVFAAAVEPAAQAFDAPAIGDRGWLDAAVMRGMCKSCSERPWPPWFALGTETWYTATAFSTRSS